MGTKKMATHYEAQLFSSSPIGKLFKNMDGSYPYDGPRVGLSPIAAGQTKLWIVFGLRTLRL